MSDEAHKETEFIPTKADGSPGYDPMPPAQQVTVGRIVHYRDRDGMVHAALVTAVVGDSQPVLAVFSLYGGVERVVEDAPFSATPRLKHWSWPPRV
jgi:hypothetical protein